MYKPTSRNRVFYIHAIVYNLKTTTIIIATRNIRNEVVSRGREYRVIAAVRYRQIVAEMTAFPAAVGGTIVVNTARYRPPEIVVSRSRFLFLIRARAFLSARKRNDNGK